MMSRHHADQITKYSRATKTKLLEEAKAAHAAKVENKSIKPVTPVEMHEYETVNASCAKRLTEKETVMEKYRRTGVIPNPFTVSSSDEEEIKEGGRGRE
ncbi:unnamed protein product [Rhizophagus irregularis]|nr:unnamed protein product [Rhizophagus irregularis]